MEQVKLKNENIHTLFRASGLLLAVEYRYIREIIPYVEPVFFPCIPSYIKGLMNYLGEICPVISLNALSGREEPVISNRTCIVMLESPNNISVHIGIIAESFMGSAKIPEPGISAYTGNIAGFGNGSIAGAAKAGNDTALVFNPFLALEKLDILNLK